jgi:hypothetical protein
MPSKCLWQFTRASNAASTSPIGSRFCRDVEGLLAAPICIARGDRQTSVTQGPVGLVSASSSYEFRFWPRFINFSVLPLSLRLG